MTPEELNSMIAHAHRRIEQMQRRLAEQQALEESRIERALARQRESDEQLTVEAVSSETERCKADFELEKQEIVRFYVNYICSKS